MSVEEQKLVNELKAGKEEAFGLLLDVYGRRLYNFALRMCRHGEDARDVVQETLLALVRSLHTYRGEGSLQAWLFHVAANACRKMRRRGKFEPEQELSLEAFFPAEQEQNVEIPDPRPNPEDRLLRTELNAVLEDAIAELPTKYRSVLLLRDVEHLSTEETARVLGLTPQAVKTRLHRARLFLRERLAPYLVASPDSGTLESKEG
ncbi:MAG: sigma-70 family RNA polymerase sigma factor [Acidobacteriota bacterium]|nr:sigma-70 family RNA polymerase sigma factor [Acidobacteriota bacterium]MDW8257736.1 sigma-70 family RNA polymerase sigma factor [Acidobacteriota bacterium]